MKKRKVGRPKTDLTFKLRTQVWLDVVSIASGWKTAGELELLFGNSVGDSKYNSKNRPGLWAKYVKGKVCPTLYSKKKGKLCIVDRVEQRYPGTAVWIRLPLWELLTERHMGMDELKDIYMSLSPRVRDLFVQTPSKQFPQFWRTETDCSEICEELIEIGDIDAFTGILCLLREAKLKQSLDEFKIALICWYECEKLLEEHPILKNHSEDIINSISLTVVGLGIDEDFW